MENQRTGGGWWKVKWNRKQLHCKSYCSIIKAKNGKGGTVAKQFHGFCFRRKTKEPFVSKLNAHVPKHMFYVFLTLAVWFGATVLPHGPWPMIGTGHTCGPEVSSGLSWWSLACCLLIWCNLELRDEWMRVAEASPSSQKRSLHCSELGRRI